jgi:hypothetical protein
MTIGFSTAALPSKALATSGVSTLVGVNGSGALVRRTNTTVFVEDYEGGTAMTGAQNATAIQAAIDYLAGLGGGFVRFGAGTYTSNPFILKNGVILVGEGSTATCLKLANSQNADFIVSDNFAGLTGTNTWLVSAGMKHGFGMIGIRVDCNKANQTSGDGIKIYGKRVQFKDIIIHDAYGRGWYSEGAYIPGQSTWQDLPESDIDIHVRNCGSHGFVFRGPHDACVSVFANANVGSGARFEVSTNVYSGSSDVRMVHVYANGSDGSDGVYVDAQCRFVHLITESNYGAGLNLASWYSQILLLQTYDNCRTSGSYSVIFGGRYNQISQWQNRNIAYFPGGMQVTGLHNTLDDCLNDGGGTSATSVVGIDHTSTAVNFTGRGKIINWSGTSAIGLKTNNGGAASYGKFDFTIDTCTTCWNNAASGFGSVYNLILHALAGSSVFSGSGPNATPYAEIWNVVGQEGTNIRTSRISKQSGSAIDLNVTTEQTISIGCTELLGLAPAVQNVQFNIYSSGTNTVWEIAYIKVIATSASQVDFKVKLKTAAGVAQTGNIIMRAALTP